MNERKVVHPSQLIASVLALAEIACGSPSGSAGGGAVGPPGDGGSPWSEATFVVDDVFYPQVAADGGGNVFLVWEWGSDDRAYSGRRIWAKRFVKGIGWAPSEMLWDIGQLAREGTLDPRIAVSGSGAAIVAWSFYGDSVWVDLFDPSSGWKGPVRLAEREYLRNQNPLFPKAAMLAADGDGGVVVFTKDGRCVQPTGPNTCAECASAYETYASRWTLTDGLSSPELALRSTCPLALADSLVASNAAGDAFVTRTLDSEIRLARLDERRGWLPEDVLSDRHVFAVWALAVDQAGAAQVLWSRTESTSISSVSYSLWAASFRPQIGWESPQRIGSPGLSIVGNVTTARDPQGGAAAVWAQLSPPGVWVSRLESSGAWTTPQALQGDASAECPAVVSNGSGGFVVAWQQAQYDPAVSSIWASRFSPTQGWAKPILVDTTVVGSTWFLGCPLLAATTDGHPLLFWQRTSTAYPPGLRPSTGDRAVYMSRLDGE